MVWEDAAEEVLPFVSGTTLLSSSSDSSSQPTSSSSASAVAPRVVST